MSVNIYDKERDVLNKISGGGTAHRILNSGGTASSQRPDLQFGAGFSVSDDEDNEKTIVNNYIKDETTDVSYKFGINNGLLYIEEV